MMRYLKIFAAFVRLNVALVTEYRANFYNSILTTISWGSINIISMFLLTTKAPSVAGWSRDELLLLTGCYSILIGIFHTFLSWNFNRFAGLIDRGEFDYILLKPVDSQFTISTRVINISALIRIVIGVVFTSYMISRLEISISIANIVGFFVLVLVGLLILYSIWFAVTTLVIWNPRLNNLAEFLFNFNNVTRYPQEVIREAGYFVFLFLFPMTLVVTIPTKALIGKVLAGDVFLLLMFATLLFGMCRVFWTYALRSYTSASS